MRRLPWFAVRPSLSSICATLVACAAPVASTPPASTAPKASPALAASAATAELAAPFAAVADPCSTSSEAKLDFSRVGVTGRSVIDDGLRFAWSGSALSFHFRGSAFRFELADSGRNWFGVTLDGVALPGKLGALAGRHCYALEQPLTPGEHRLTLTRLTEAMLGESSLIAANTGGSGEILPAEARPARRIEVIGDSISAAYGVEGPNRDCHFSPETENEALSYAALAARHFGAELTDVAWSGKGVFSNRGSSDTLLMPALWERTLPERSDSRWDFSSATPDAVVVDLGTNDFAPEVPDKGPFADAYRAFLFRVRAAYPKAALFCALSPMLSDEWPPDAHSRSTARAGIQAAVDTAHARGDSRVYFFEHQTPTEAEGWGCDWHPSKATHARMANELSEQLAKNLGW